jgi:uncharacterized membrane protein
MSVFDSLYALISEMNQTNVIIYAAVIAVAVIVSIVSFALLMPLNGLQAVQGVTVILGISYGLALVAWLIVMTNNRNTEALVWLNTHLMFLVILPTVLGATVMNISAIQNARNLVAGKLTS